MLLSLAILIAVVGVTWALWRFHVHEKETERARKESYDLMLAASKVEFPITVTVPGESPQVFSNLQEVEGTLEFFDTKDNDGVVVDAKNRRVSLRIERCWTEVLEHEKSAV